MSFVDAFLVNLEEFGLTVEADALIVVRESAQIAAENIVIGGEYGPGAPLDTGFLRASFEVTLNAPATGPSTPPPRPAGRKAGDGSLYATTLDTAAVATATLADVIYVTTPAEYAEYLEYDGLTRRHGDTALVGTPTAFVRQVSVRWDRIVERVASERLSR